MAGDGENLSWGSCAALHLSMDIFSALKLNFCELFVRVLLTERVGGMRLYKLKFSLC